MSIHDQTYTDQLLHVLQHGSERTDRTGTGTISTFGLQARYDLTKGFPLLTTKRVYWKGVVGELLWFLSGDTNVKWLQENDIHIWDQWADENGNLGPVYGAQWRSWLQWVDSGRKFGRNEIDQIKTVIEQIKTNPDSRRHIVSAWNVAEIDDMKLPPCHLLFQFYVQDGRLSCQLYQRSADMFLGVPFNIASYALLTHMIAHVTDLEVGDFVHTIGDAHIYSNHLNQVQEQISRPFNINAPTLILDDRVTGIDDFDFDNIRLDGYNPLPAIKAEVAV